jgi:hypothetical protein
MLASLYEQASIPEGQEIVKEKPGIPIGLREQTTAFQDGSDVGQIFQNASLYDSGVSQNGRRRVYIFVWIWKDSLDVFENNSLQLKNDENVRTAAMGTIVGRLKAHTIASLLHVNSKNSWILACLDLEISEDMLTAEETSQLFFNNTQRTVTKSGAGELPATGTLEIDLILYPFEHPLKFLGLVLGWGVIYLTGTVILKGLSPNIRTLFKTNRKFRKRQK